MDQHEIAQIRTQFAAHQWSKFLQSVKISGLRGWNSETVDFNFPIVAVVGENGTGKTTLLRAAASAYEGEHDGEGYFPSAFFLDTPWDEIQGVTLEYVVKQGPMALTYKFAKPQKRWSYPDAKAKRRVFFFDITRTLPIDATIGYAKIAKSKSAEVAVSEIEEEYRRRLSHILGREYTAARFARVDENDKLVGVLSRDNVEISQFHQGAGEDATLDLISSLQGIPNYSLLIIDEVEASLHPRAQRRLVRFLLWLVRQKKIQVILSTHSPYVLEELPQEARIMLLPGPAGINIVHGASAEFSMSKIDEGNHPELYCYVEDKEGEVFLREILASDENGRGFLPRVAMYPVGPANVVNIMGSLGAAGRLPKKSIAFVDGDIAPGTGTTAFPGTVPPERLVFTELKAQNWLNLTDRFGVGAGDLHQWLDDAMLDPDHHRWTAKVGDRVLKSKSAVWEIMAAEWCKICLTGTERERIVNIVRTALEAP